MSFFRTLTKFPRYTAFAIHLGVSLILLAAIFAIVYLVWFPYALARASGGLEGLIIVIGVDIVLGPLLTFAVFNVSKSPRVLAMDIGIIVALQLGALGGGIFAVHQARPIAVVYVYDTFFVLRQQDFAYKNVNLAPLQAIPEDYPKVVYVKTNASQMAHAIQQAFDKLTGTPLQFYPDKYLVIPRNRQQAMAILRRPQHYVDTGCIQQNIESAYTSGRVCFNPATQIFTDFVPQQAVQYEDNTAASSTKKPE